MPKNTSFQAFLSFAYLRKLAVVTLGLFISAVGIVVNYRSGLGLGPWDVLHQGISRHMPLTFGVASIVVGGLVVAINLVLKVRPGMGTLLNLVLVGIFVDFLLRYNLIPVPGTSNVLALVLLDVLGIFLMGLGTAIYISQQLSAGPRDGLMLRLNTLIKVRIFLVRLAIECFALIAGFCLGGTVGIGTLLFAFGIGPAIEICVSLLLKAQSLLTAHSESGKVSTSISQGATGSFPALVEQHS